MFMFFGFNLLCFIVGYNVCCTGVCGIICVGIKGQFVRVLYCYLIFITCSASDIGLCVSMLVLFIC
jgi:hypothetical protein